jgi:hypothetical protein
LTALKGGPGRIRGTFRKPFTPAQLTNPISGDRPADAYPGTCSRGGSVPKPEIDIRRSDPMNACPVLPLEPAEILTASPLPQLRRLVVTVNEVEVVITGRVSSYYMKQLAQEALRPTLGDRRLLNHVEVCPA